VIIAAKWKELVKKLTVGEVQLLFEHRMDCELKSGMRDLPNMPNVYMNEAWTGTAIGNAPGIPL
jgi:hypothetical protein